VNSFHLYEKIGPPFSGGPKFNKECNAKRLHGELKSYKASVECSNPKIFAAYREAGDPNLDLLNVYLAARLVGVENVDKKRVTEAEYKLQLAELESRLTKERQRRALAVADLEIKRAQAAAETAQAAQAQSNAALLLGLAALQSANRPASQPSQLAMPSPPPRVLNTNCQTYGQRQIRDRLRERPPAYPVGPEIRRRTLFRTSSISTAQPCKNFRGVLGPGSLSR
jgi:hypothetical protein